jgi:predicted MFS family arabinose efflux permease
VLICAAIAAMSLASVVDQPIAKLGLIVLAIAVLAVMLIFDRSARFPLLPSDAFSLHSVTGVGLWIALLLNIAFNPVQVFLPIFLQRLHGFDPISAGYTVASASMSWTAAAIAVARLANGWPGRLIIAGPWVMAAGLLGIALLMPSGPMIGLFLAIVLVGAGIGASWAFTAQRIMSGARPGEEDIAASSAATAQQAGLALGAAVAGVVANTVGFSLGADAVGITRAAFWVPASFASAAVLAGLMGVRLNVLTRRSGALR